jgi:hypothetical protein
MGESTNREHVNHVENDWTVTIAVDDREERTRAIARLVFDGREWVGVGLSRLGAAERGVAGVGSHLATARALSDLARRMMAVTGVPVTSRAEQVPPSGRTATRDRDDYACRTTP